MPDIVDIAVPVGVRKTFAYSVPPAFREKIRIGMRVLVPFGPKLLTGYVIGSMQKDQVGSIKLRNVQELLEPEPAVTDSRAPTKRFTNKLNNASICSETPNGSMRGDQARRIA